MRKVLLSFLIGCMGFISGHASTIFYSEGETNTNQEWINMDIIPDVPHPKYILDYSFMYNPYMSALIIFGGRDPAHVVLENLSTGEQYFYTYDYLSAENGFIPFTGGDGVWRLSFCSAVPHEPRIIINRGFSIYNGVFTLLF